MPKKSGEKSHLFEDLLKNFYNENNHENNLEINLQEISNDKYLIYKINSNLVDYNSKL